MDRQPCLVTSVRARGSLSLLACLCIAALPLGCGDDADSDVDAADGRGADARPVADAPVQPDAPQAPDAAANGDGPAAQPDGLADTATAPDRPASDARPADAEHEDAKGEDAKGEDAKGEDAKGEDAKEADADRADAPRADDAGGMDGSPGVDATAGIVADAQIAAFPCRSDSDCCTLVDNCGAKAYLYSKADGASPPPTIPTPQPGSTCLPCILPSVQVRCVSRQCVGEKVPYSSPALSAGHCGFVRMDAGTDVSYDLLTDPPVTPTVWTCG